MVRSLLLIALLAACGDAHADTRHLHGLGEPRYEYVESRATGRGYHLFVGLPQDYAETEKTYPTLYLLDGGALYPMLAAYHRYLVEGGEAEPAIVIGIAYGAADFAGGNFRATDYTAPSPERDYWGGAEAFQAFLADELLPGIERRYRSDPARRTLLGHSIGGQFVLYTAQTRPGLFALHLASNPALHRNLPFFLQARPAPDAEQPTRIFVGHGSADVQRFARPRDEWIRHWSTASGRRWTLELRELEGHSHMSTPPAVLREGLRWAQGAGEPAAECRLSDADRQAVAAAGADYIAAWLSNDPAGVARLLADDVVMVPHHGNPPRSGKAAVLEWWFPGGAVVAPILAYDLAPAEVGGCGDLAFDRGRMQEIAYEWNGQVIRSRGGNYLTLYRRSADGEWLIVRRIWNDPLPEAEAP